jgi:hypothetical protein
MLIFIHKTILSSLEFHREFGRRQLFAHRYLYEGPDKRVIAEVDFGVGSSTYVSDFATYQDLERLATPGYASGLLMCGVCTCVSALLEHSS